MVFLTVDFLLLVCGCLTTEEAVSGFSNMGALTIAFLGVASKGVNETHALDAAVKLALGN